MTLDGPLSRIVKNVRDAATVAAAGERVRDALAGESFHTKGADPEGRSVEMWVKVPIT